MRFIWLVLIALASFQGYAHTTLIFSGQGFGLTATLSYDEGSSASGTVIANTKTSGLCHGKFFTHEDEDGLILIISFLKDGSDRRYCKGNDTTMKIASDRIEALTGGHEVKVTYTSAIQLLMKLKGTVKLVTP